MTMTADEAWQAVSDAAKNLADIEGNVEKAIALRGRRIHQNAGEEEIVLSASLSCLLVRELKPLAEAVDGNPTGAVIHFVLPRGWNDDPFGDRVGEWLDQGDRS